MSKHLRQRWAGLRTAALEVRKIKPSDMWFVDRGAERRSRAEYAVFDGDVPRAYIRAESDVSYMSSPGWMITVYTEAGFQGPGDPYTNKAPKGDSYASTLAEAKVKAVENVEKFDRGELR